MKHFLSSLAFCLLAAAFWVPDAEASCTARVICQVTVISCQGNSVCQSGPDWVECDNQGRIDCPVCQAQTTCCDGRFIYCNGDSTCEDNPGRWVKCDGQIQGFCPLCRSSTDEPEPDADVLLASLLGESPTRGCSD